MAIPWIRAAVSLWLFIWTPAVLAQSVLISTGAVWKYFDNGTDQGNTWRGLLFDDSSWASGPAQLGYGDGDEATTNSFGTDASNKYVTTYYRHSFTVVDPLIYTNLELRLLRDDGAIVYLNGLEVFRCNLPTGAVTYLTLAQAAAPDDGTFWIPVDVPVGSLRAGTNVVAVEMHQNSRSSSDLSFDLALLGNVPRTAPLTTFARGSRTAGGNDHIYEAVAAPGGLTWDGASASATNRGGYLATVTSAEENALIFQLIKDRPELWLLRPTTGNRWGPWLGGLQPVGSAEPAGGWSWVTREQFTYAHWAPGEPNDSAPGEDRLHFFAVDADVGDLWNDKANSENRIVSFVVEYEQVQIPDPILEFTFNETGVNAFSTGSETNAAIFLVGSSTVRDLHSADTRGVSGLPGDRAFDNSISSGMGSAGSGGRATISDTDGVDGLLSLTLQGWFEAEGAGLTDLARLISKQSSATGFLLLGTGGNLSLEINNVGTTSTGVHYADAGIWVFFAVTYDGTASANNVRFYKGTRTNVVTLVETRTLNQGRALENSGAITIGNANSDGSLMRPFDGWLDNFRVFGNSINSSGALSLQQLEFLRSKDVQNVSDPIALSISRNGIAIDLVWPAYPGGFHLESKTKLNAAAPWTAVTNRVQVDANQNIVSVTAMDSIRFFRLAR